MGEQDVNLRESLLGIRRAAGAGDIDLLIGALKSPALEVRLAAVEALGAAGGEKVGIALLSVVRDRPGERPDVRIAALRALGSVHDPDRYASILEEFVCGDSPGMVAAARDLLSGVDPQGYPRRLVARRCLDHRAIGVYGRSREAAALPLLRDFLEEGMRGGGLARAGSWGRVYAAVKALGKIGGPEAVSILEELLAWLPEAETGGAFRRERLQKIGEAARSSVEKAGM